MEMVTMKVHTHTHTHTQEYDRPVDQCLGLESHLAAIFFWFW